MKVEKKLKLNFIIIDRAFENKVTKFLKKHGFDKYFMFFAKGSATSEILDCLGISENEKVVYVYPSNEKDANKLFQIVRDSEYLKHCLVFRCPVKGISSKKSLDYFLKGVIGHE